MCLKSDKSIDYIKYLKNAMIVIVKSITKILLTFSVPICMPPDEADFTGRVATVTGWGRLKYGGGVPAVLQEVQVC